MYMDKVNMSGRELKTNFSGLLESMIAKMDDGVAFVCLVCQKVVLHKGNLKKHIVSMHIGESPQECPLCGKSFKNLNSLQNHTSIHHRGLVPVHSQLWLNCLCKCSFSINYILTQNCFFLFLHNTRQSATRVWQQCWPLILFNWNLFCHN